MNEKIERLKAELVVFKGLMSDVSATSRRPRHHDFPHTHHAKCFIHSEALSSASS
jgi:hypothetical protein